MATLVIAILALVLAIAAGWWIWVLQSRLAQMVGNGDAKSLQSHLTAYSKRVESVDNRLNELTSEYARLASAQSLSSQKISIVRFNPFGDTGGDQSFTLAVLDAHDSGYVITSIHGRTGTRVYVKPIDFGDSKYPLSDEEKQALEQARKRTTSTKK